MESALGRSGPANPPAAPGVPWLRYTALATGILSVVAGFLAVRGSDLANQAIYHSNQAVLFQAQASDAFAEYEADSLKARIVETALLATTGLDPAAKTKLEAQSKEFRGRQPPLQQKAKDREADRDRELALSQRRLGDKDTLAYAGVAIQLGIGLASIAALTHRFAALVAGVLAGAVGLVITAIAFLPALFGQG
ncbi:MAG: hypothetical protein NVSMB8_06530 [Candidatus Limnocylindrales bacterium]